MSELKSSKEKLKKLAWVSVSHSLIRRPNLIMKVTEKFTLHCNLSTLIG